MSSAQPYPYIQFTNPVSTSPSFFSPNLPVIPAKFSMQSLFSDNSLVCYKNHSLSVSSGGTVVNARHKGRKT